MKKKINKLSYPKNKAANKKKTNKGRTTSGKIPQGRTLTTRDNYLGTKRTTSTKERPVVVIEADKENNLAVVPLTTQKGLNRTRLKNYQQGQSYFKHYVEIEDNEGKPIRINKKFRENHKNQDILEKDVTDIRKKIFIHSKPAPKNRKKMEVFRGNKKSPRD